MFKFSIPSSYSCRKLSKYTFKNNFLISNFFLKKKIWFFFIFLTGRIFRWVRVNYFIKLLLPDSNKPHLFFKAPTFFVQAKNKPEFIILPVFFNERHILKMLTNIRKQSIFNKRGFRIYNRIFYKKRGKITTYVTNK